jgi:hypothetical protein
MGSKQTLPFSRFYPKSTAVHGILRLKEVESIDGQFDALPMLIDGVGASSADGAVPRFISARSQEVFRRNQQRPCWKHVLNRNSCENQV